MRSRIEDSPFSNKPYFSGPRLPIRSAANISTRRSLYVDNERRSFHVWTIKNSERKFRAYTRINESGWGQRLNGVVMETKLIFYTIQLYRCPSRNLRLILSYTSYIFSYWFVLRLYVVYSPVKLGWKWKRKNLFFCVRGVHWHQPGKLGSFKNLKKIG